MTLDRMDKRILKALQKDGRIGNAELAKKLGMSATACWNHTKRLMDDGYVKEVRAVLDEQQMALSKVLNLQVGETLILNASAESPIQLKCGAIPLTTGRMGRKGHSIAVRVDAPLASAAKRRLIQAKK